MPKRVPSTNDAVKEAHKLLDEMGLQDGSLAIRTIILAGNYLILAHKQKDLETTNHAALVNTLVYHQQTNTSGCHCGWAVLGASWAEHVASIYEEVLKEG